METLKLCQASVLQREEHVEHIWLFTKHILLCTEHVNSVALKVKEVIEIKKQIWCSYFVMTRRPFRT